MAQLDEIYRTGTIPPWTLGWRLQRALAFAGISAEQMAAELGVHRGTISRWMNDKGTPPKAVYLKQWALRCGVPYDWLSGVVLPHLDSNQEPSASPSTPDRTGEYEFPEDAQPDILTFRKVMGLGGAPRHGTRVPDHPNRVR